jgi:hypothetical protein
MLRVASERVSSLTQNIDQSDSVYSFRREIAKSDWVRWAELLLSRNINLTDKNGKKWRPRLKTR